MQRAFSCRDCARHLLRMTIAHTMFACMLPLGMAVPETAFANDDPQSQPILCKMNQNVESAECLQRFQGLATREGDVLRLNLESGKTKTLADLNKGCDPFKCLAFHLAAFYPSLQSFLVEAISYECGHYELISRRSGSVVKISASAIPELSPNGKYLVSVDQSDACDRAYDLAIWSTNTDPPAPGLKYRAKRYENWSVAGWSGDDRIKLKVWVNDHGESYDQDVEAVRSAQGWKLVLGERVDRGQGKPAPWPSTAAPPAYVTPPSRR